MLKPQRLNVGDTVALVNPAGMPPERFRHYIPLMEEYLQTEGFKTKTYYASDDAEPKELAEVFTSAWADSEVKAVFPICGGFSIYEVIKHLDIEALRSHPRAYCGIKFALGSIDLDHSKIRCADFLRSTHTIPPYPISAEGKRVHYPKLLGHVHVEDWPDQTDCHGSRKAPLLPGGPES